MTTQSHKAEFLDSNEFNERFQSGKISNAVVKIQAGRGISNG